MWQTQHIIYYVLSLKFIGRYQFKNVIQRLRASKLIFVAVGSHIITLHIMSEQ